MDKLDIELDEFYVSQISQCLLLIDEAERLIEYWEKKRTLLRHKNVN